MSSSPAAGSPITVEVVRDPRELPALAARWDAWIDEDHPGAVFRSSAWIVPWWNHFSSGKDLCVLVARRAAGPVAVLPGYTVATVLGRRFRLLGDGTVGSDYLGPIVAPGEDAAAVCGAIADHLIRRQRDLVLQYVSDDDPMLAALASSTTVEPRAETPCPTIPITESFDAYAARLPNGAGAQLTRRRRWLEKRPGYRMEIVTAPAEMDRAMDELFRLHRERWSLEGGSDGITDERVEAFHRDAAGRVAERGWARVYLLHCEGAVRAALYGFGRGRGFAYYQAGHEVEWRKRSVGTVVLGAAIEDAFSRGLAEFDLLHGDEPYKATFSTARRRLVEVRVAAGAPASLLRFAERAEERARRQLRAALPTEMVDRLRKIRRSIGSLGGAPALGVRGGQ